MSDSVKAVAAEAISDRDPLALLVSIRTEWKSELAQAFSMAGWQTQFVDTASEAEWRGKSQSPALVLIDFERVDAFCPLLVSELAAHGDPETVIVTAGGYALPAFRVQMETAGAAEVYDGPADVEALLRWIEGTALPLAEPRDEMGQAVSQR